MTCTETRSPRLKRSLLRTTAGRVWMWMALAARYRTLFSRSSSRLKMLRVTMRISPNTAPAASSSANDGIARSAAGAGCEGGGGSPSGDLSWAAARPSTHAASAKQPAEKAIRRPRASPRSARDERRAEFVAPGSRVSPSDDVVVRSAVGRDDLAVANEENHRVGSIVGAAHVL